MSKIYKTRDAQEKDESKESNLKMNMNNNMPLWKNKGDETIEECENEYESYKKKKKQKRQMIL